MVGEGRSTRACTHFHACLDPVSSWFTGISAQIHAQTERKCLTALHLRSAYQGECGILRVCGAKGVEGESPASAYPSTIPLIARSEFSGGV